MWIDNSILHLNQISCSETPTFRWTLDFSGIYFMRHQCIWQCQFPLLVSPMCLATSRLLFLIIHWTNWAVEEGAEGLFILHDCCVLPSIKFAMRQLFACVTLVMYNYKCSSDNTIQTCFMAMVLNFQHEEMCTYSGSMGTKLRKNLFSSANCVWGNFLEHEMNKKTQIEISYFDHINHVDHINYFDQW